MKTQKNLSIKVRDLEPLKDVTGGRHRARGLQGEGFATRFADSARGLGPFGLLRPQ
jgi:hypothetical protein